MKPEVSFNKAVDKALIALDAKIHIESISTNYSRGIPDSYYERGKQMLEFRILWVEYKWYEKIPPTMSLCSGDKPKLSALQQLWLNRAVGNNVPCYVIVGFGRGRGRKGIVLTAQEDWERSWTREEVEAEVVPIPDVARVIEKALS